MNDTTAGAGTEGDSTPVGSIRLLLADDHTMLREALIHYRDFAPEVKTRSTGRAHPEPGGQPVHRYVWNRMVLQREPHFKNGIVPRCWQVSKSRYEFSKWHGIREGIHGCLMHRP